MARNFRELEQKMPPDSLERARDRAKQMMAEMLPAETRRSVRLAAQDPGDEGREVTVHSK